MQFTKTISFVCQNLTMKETKYEIKTECLCIPGMPYMVSPSNCLNFEMMKITDNEGGLTNT